MRDSGGGVGDDAAIALAAGRLQGASVGGNVGGCPAPAVFSVPPAPRPGDRVGRSWRRRGLSEPAGRVPQPPERMPRPGAGLHGADARRGELGKDVESKDVESEDVESEDSGSKNAAVE